MARLNRARSRARPSICSLVRIDQTCFALSGGFAPISLPLFHGVRLGCLSVVLSSICIGASPPFAEGEQHAPFDREKAFKAPCLSYNSTFDATRPRDACGSGGRDEFR